MRREWCVISKRVLSVILSATMIFSPMGALKTKAAKKESVDKVVRLDPTKASIFNDTDGDGLGEFEGFGTSLCWWANRIGGNATLTEKAGKLFFNKDEGLGMNIGRYNIGGGDLVGEVKIPEAKPNPKAHMYDLMTEGKMPSYAGKNMSVKTLGLGDTTYKYSDADFGFLKGSAVGSFKYVGWINKLDDTVGDGDNLRYTVDVPEAGEYTVKLLLTLTGNNNRDVALRVIDKADIEEVTTEETASEGFTDYIVEASDINNHQIANDGSNKLYIATIRNVKLVEGCNQVVIAGKNDWTLDFIKMAVIKAGDEANEDDMEKAENEEAVEVPEFFHSEHIIRSDSAVPGYCVDVTRMDLNEKSLTEYKNEYARVDEISGFAWNYDWDADAAQINVLKAAMKNSKDEFIPEIFSNSPPYFMTVSGCSSGNVDANKDNLRADCYDAFAKYMADVMKHWYDNGIKFQSATPMNEPYTNYWAARSNKQEGCHFDIGDSQSRIYTTLRKELNEQGLNDIILSATDETSIDTAITAYKALSGEAKSSVERIDTHTYGGSKRTELKKLAESEGKNLWMSEVDGGFTAGSNAGQMSAALGLGQRMIEDVNGLRSSAWILWNTIDMHVDSSSYGKSWVDKGSSNDFLTKEEMYSRWMAKDSDGYWGIAAANHDTNEIYLTKKYYGYGQFSRYIRPGYTIIGSSSEGSVMAAYDSKDNKVVVVAMNTTVKDESWKFDLSLFNEVGKNATVQAIRTSGSLDSGENWADVSKDDDIVVEADKKSMSATVKANSITTYIISDVTYDPNKSVSDKMTEITISKDAITGSKPWSGGTGCDVDKLIDNDMNTFFDGVTNGYVIVDLGAETELAAVAYAPRSGYTDRAVGAMIAGSNDGEKWTKLYTITEKPSAGVMTYVYSSQFAGNTNKYRYIKYYVEGSGSNCNVAELKFFTYEPIVADVEEVTAVAAPGKIPVLPARVEGKTSTGQKHSFQIEWKIDESAFKNSKPLDRLSVKGTVVGNDLEIEAKVLIIPEGLEYFVDCNNNYSENFEIAKANRKSLLNMVPDQKKDNLSWGYLDKYGAYDSSTSGESGWYAYGNQNIEYSFRLPAGYHEITLCGSGVWWNTSRNMQITYVSEGKETEICSLKTLKGKEVVATGKIELAKESDIVVRIKKAKGENQDPVLSWITIAGPITYAKGIVYSNGNLKLPKTTTLGQEIKWESNKVEVSSDLFKYMEVEGNVDGQTDKKVKGSALVIPEKLEYFISCNSPKCPEWQLVCENENILNNDAADQKKTSGNKWGRLEDYGTYDDESNPAAGGYYSKTPIEYIVPLTAGVHDIYACANGWWWSQWCSSRSMDVTYVVDGTEKPLFTLTTKKDKEVIGKGKIILSKDSDVIIRIKKASGEKEDSIISWLAISNNSNLSFTGTNGDQMYDIDGNRIQAHGGQIQKIADTWYWVGEDKTYGYQPCPGVHMYSSKDLYNWKDEGVVLKTMTSYEQFETDEYFKQLYGKLNPQEKKLIYTDLAQGDSLNGYKTVIERPKMLFNEKTGKYVIWFHADGKNPYDNGGDSNYAKAKAGIAIADSPTGPYTLLGSYLLATGTKEHGFDNEVGGHVRDMNLFKDDDGTAYVLYSSEGNAVMYIAKLNDSYTGLVKDADKMLLGKDFVISSTDSREAPAMFKYESKYYLITSACTGWSPNQARYAVADSPLGPWKNMGDPCVGDSTNLTFSTQSTCVVAVDSDAGKYFYMGDRWFSNKLEDSRYVWLPIEFGSNNTIMIRDYKDWTLDDLNNKASINVNDNLVSEADSITDLLSKLPSELNIIIAGKETTKKVEWKVSDDIASLDENFIGEVTINGTLTDMNREVSTKVIVSPKNLVYLTDCYTNTEENTSNMFKTIAARSKYLNNTVSDQAYGKDPNSNKLWGYISKPGAKGASSSEDMGSKGTGDFFETGWWATSTGSIAYDYELKPGKYRVATGFNEWWSATREINISVINVDESGEEKILGTKSFTMKNNKNLEKVIEDIEVPDNSKHVIVKIAKKSGGDPILSWIGIIADKEPTEEDDSKPVDKKPTNNNPSNGGNNNNQQQNSSASKNTTKNEVVTVIEAAKAVLAPQPEVQQDQKVSNNNSRNTKTNKNEDTNSVISVTENESVEKERVDVVSTEDVTDKMTGEDVAEIKENNSESLSDDVVIADSETPLADEPSTNKISKMIIAIVVAITAMAGILITFIFRKNITIQNHHSYK